MYFICLFLAIYTAGAMGLNLSPAIRGKHIESEGTEAESGESKQDPSRQKSQGIQRHCFLSRLCFGRGLLAHPNVNRVFVRGDHANISFHLGYICPAEYYYSLIGVLGHITISIVSQHIITFLNV